MHRITGEPIDSLREHARLLQTERRVYLAPAGVPESEHGWRGQSVGASLFKSEARELFKDFSEVDLQTYFLNKRWLPLVGSVLPRALEVAVGLSLGLASMDLCDEVGVDTIRRLHRFHRLRF